MNVYLAMYSTEITAGAALLIGLALGAWLGYEHGKDEKDKAQFDAYMLGAREYAAATRQPRDAKGRFTR
jgi:hypothetical protein